MSDATVSRLAGDVLCRERRLPAHRTLRVHDHGHDRVRADRPRGPARRCRKRAVRRRFVARGRITACQHDHDRYDRHHSSHHEEGNIHCRLGDWSGVGSSGVEIADSARKHGIAEVDIAHAVRHELRTIFQDDRLFIIGPAETLSFSRSWSSTPTATPWSSTPWRYDRGSSTS